MNSKNWMGEFPKVKIAGQEFYAIPGKEWREEMEKIGLYPPRKVDGSGQYLENDSRTILMPYYPPDDKLDFPGGPKLDDCGWLVQSGIAQHSVPGREPPRPSEERSNLAKGFAATQLNVFSEMDWYGECFGVLEAHGWTEHGTISVDLLKRLMEVEGPDIVDEAREKFGGSKPDDDNTWKAYLLELAATHFTEPLSRVWYAANMQSLFYCRYDDLRLGYLWAEYLMKMRAELFALKHIEMTERNRENGLKGGQSDKKLERYQVLNRLARQQHFKELAFASDRDGIRVARKIAAEYDKGADTPLFTVRGKDLSKDWYGEWLGQFRHMARGIE